MYILNVHFLRLVDPDLFQKWQWKRDCSRRPI